MYLTFHADFVALHDSQISWTWPSRRRRRLLFLLVTFFVFLSVNADQETRTRSRRQITDTEACAMQTETREEKRRVTRVSGAFFVEASAAHHSHTRSVCTYWRHSSHSFWSFTNAHRASITSTIWVTSTILVGIGVLRDQRAILCALLCMICAAASSSSRFCGTVTSTDFSAPSSG